MAITVHLEVKGSPLCLLLDFVEVARSHSGVALATEFVRVLEEFGIENKVSRLECDTNELLTCCKILSVTADNASVNDSMVDRMGEELEDFAGEVARTRCFDHILSLGAKTVTKLFDLPKTKAGDTRSTEEQELMDLAGDIDLEETYMQQLEGDDAGADDIEGWIDEESFLSKEEAASLNEAILPVRRVIVKVRSADNELRWS
jgi:hypothetical protein